MKLLIIGAFLTLLVSCNTKRVYSVKCYVDGKVTIDETNLDRAGISYGTTYFTKNGQQVEVFQDCEVREIIIDNTGKEKPKVSLKEVKGRKHRIALEQNHKKNDEDDDDFVMAVGIAVALDLI